MSPLQDRRSFLRDTSLAATALVGLSSELFTRTVQAIEPIARTGKPKIKFSLAAYSYRSFLKGSKGKPPQLTLHDFIDDCAAMGLEGTELTSYYFPPEPSREYLCDLKHHAFRLGLDVSGTAVGNKFCDPPGPARDQQIAHVKQWIDYAETLGAPVIRIFSGRQAKGQTLAEAHKLAVTAIEECCDYAGQHGVFLALENHGGLTATIDGILALLRDVKSRWFGINLDTGNFHTEDPYGDLEKLVPYSLNVQVKVAIKPANGPQQPSDFKRLARMLIDGGYRGYVVLEYEEKEDPRTACPRYLDQLRAVFS